MRYLDEHSPLDQLIAADKVADARTAVFYSISATQPGLRGVDLGNFLIKRVVQTLRSEPQLSHITTFVTLSPIPGFTKWIRSSVASRSNSSSSSPTTLEEAASGAAGLPSFFQLTDEDRTALLGELQTPLTTYDTSQLTSQLDETVETVLSDDEVLIQVLDAIVKSNTDPSPAVGAVLSRLALRYLYQEKKKGRALDSVANFHLRNGAKIERINWLADMSEKGRKKSSGLMVNYKYDLSDIVKNQCDYMETGTINVSETISTWLAEKERK